MRVVLVQPPDEMAAMLGVGKELVQKYEPLGLLYLAAIARLAGWQPCLVDAYAEGLTLEQVQARILATRPEVVGVSVLTCSGEAAFRLGRWLKEALPGTLVVFGNVHASTFAREYLEHRCCDAVAHGEGEAAFAALLEHRLGRRDLRDVPGVSFRGDDGRVVRTCAGPALSEDLSALPEPARDIVDRRHYRLDAVGNQLWVGKSRSCSMTMSTSRGCRFKCTFCVVNQKPRFNDPVRVADEMERLEKEHGADYTLFVDPLCMDDVPRMLRLCEEIRRRRLRIRWGCDARVSCVTPELVRAMDAANCHDLSFGIESGVQRLLNAVKKGTTLEQVRRAVRTVKDATDIQIGGLFILGLPGETPAESAETIRFATELPLDMAQFGLCTPYPGSSLFETLSARGELDTGVREDGSLDFGAWRRYSAYISFTDADPIWVTPGRTAAELKALQKRAQRRFYLRPSQILKHARRIGPTNALRAARVAAGAFF